MARKLVIAAGMLSFAFIGLWFVAPQIAPYSAVNCWDYDFDIAGGRQRYQRYLLWLRVRSRVEETELSRRYRKCVGELPDPKWRRTSTHSPGSRSSPSYKHDRSWLAAMMLMHTLDVGTFTEQAEGATIRTFLGLLQEDESARRAFHYAEAVRGKMYEQAAKKLPPIDMNQLPKVEDLRKTKVPPGAPPPGPGP